MWYFVRTLNCPSIIRPNDENFPSEPSSVSRSFKLFQLASVRTSQQHVRTPLSIQSAMGFLSKTQIWEDSYNRPNDVDSRPDALIHKASRAFKNPDVRTLVFMVRTLKLHKWKLRASDQPSGRQMSWSGRSKPWYGNCVQLKCDHPDAAQFKKEFQRILESQLHSCLFGRLMSIIWTAPRYFKPDAHLNL